MGRKYRNTDIMINGEYFHTLLLADLKDLKKTIFTFKCLGSLGRMAQQKQTLETGCACHIPTVQ